MKLIQFFDIKTRTLGFAFCQPQKKSLPKYLTQKKSLQNFKPPKSPQIANFKLKKGLRTSPSFIYLSTPLGPTGGVANLPGKLQVLETFHSISKSRNGICDESQSLVFVSFLESWINDLFAVKSQIFKQGLCVSASLGFYHSPALTGIGAYDNA